MAKEAVLYEAMYILDSSLTDEEVAALEEQFRTAIEGQGATFESVHEFARRRLAYAIKGHTDGIYRVMYFRSSGAAVEEIKHEFALSEDVVRGIVTVANPKMLVGPKPAPKAEEAEAPAEAAAEAPAETAEEAPVEAAAEAPVEAAAEAPAEAAAEAPAEAAAEAPAEAAAEAPAEAAAEAPAEAAAEAPAEAAAEAPVEAAAEAPAEAAAEAPAEAAEAPAETPTE